MPKNSAPFQPDDYFRLRFLQDAALSPDGESVVYSVLHTDTTEEPPVDRKTIFLHNIINGYTKQMTNSTRLDHSPVWSPDGKQIAFISDRTEKPQIFLLPVDGGEARQLTKLPNGVGGGPVWSPDGKSIAFTAAAQDAAADPSEPYRFTRPIYRFDGLGRTDRNHQNVWLIPSAGGEAQQLTSDGFHYAPPRWSPDGGHLLAIGSLGPESHSIRGQVRLIGLDGTVTPLTGEWGSADTAEWTPDGRSILFAGAPAGTDIGTQNGLWRVDVDLADFGKSARSIVNLTPDLPFHVAGRLQVDMPSATVRQPRIACVEDAAFVRVQCGGEVRIYRVALDGNTPPELTVGGERFCEIVGLAGERMLFWANSFHDPLNLYTKNLVTGEEQQITHLNDEILERIALPGVEHLEFPGEDGERVEGWLLTPANGAAPWPGFLYIHGGPHSAFGHGFSADFQMLAGAGYAVLAINHRASTGYGDAFATAIKGDWGHLDYTDLMAGVDYAIERGLLDPARLALGGLSGGGNLTCWIVGQTDRFKAAIPENPVTNWVSFYGVSDIGPWFAVEELGGQPHEIPEIYRRCSPITYAHRCTTPTLLVQGESDHRCPPEQSEQFYAVLKASGCPVEMLRLPGSPHGGAITGAPVLRRAQNAALLEWVQRWN
ncbi:MAG: S9 family peptidase [Caldilineaceae bacterium]|nr:S9 family peptidase [Caldilineaceae bacterium]